MKIFGFGQEQNAVEQAEAAVEKATAKCDRIRTQLTDTERELGVSKEAAADHAAEGHSLDDWAHDIAAQEAACSALKTALGRAASELVEAQGTLAYEQDQAERTRSVAEIEALRADMREPFEQLISAIAKLLPLAKQAAVYQLDMQQVAGLLEQWSVDASAAVEIANTGLAHHAEAIRSGTCGQHCRQRPRPSPSSGQRRRPHAQSSSSTTLGGAKMARLDIATRSGTRRCPRTSTSARLLITLVLMLRPTKQ